MSFLQDVQTFLNLSLAENGLIIAPDDKIVTAVSGGPDSLTLLHLLAQRSWHPVENIIVAHLDHQLRPSSAEEAAQVCRISAEWGAVCRIKQVDVRAAAQKDGFSIEEAGRQERYRFFAEIMAESGARLLFTGHHADDQVETVLMHILRGSGSAGLRGILPIGPLAGQPGSFVIRPLLNTNRQEIEAYCERHQLQPFFDESNRDTTFFRNRLRHELLPILEGYNPQIRQRLQAMSAVTAADYEWLQQQTAEAGEKITLEQGNGWLRFDLAGWQRLPLSLRRQTLRAALAQLRPNLRDVGFQSLELARQVGEKGIVGSEAALPGEIMLVVGYKDILLRLANTDLPAPQYPQLLSEAALTLPIPGQLSLANGWILKCEWLPEFDPEQMTQNNNPWIAYLDAAGLDSLVVRPRLAGERFQPFGMDGRTKTVKEVMIDRKIPAQLRPHWPIIAAAHLLWIAGHLLDERAKIRPTSQKILKIMLVRGER